MENKKVAILFFGLTRSLSKTIDSIKRNLFTPLNDNLIHYDIFIHTYKIFGSYNNLWSNESTSNYNNEDIETLLNPKYVIFDNQETILNTIDFNDYYKEICYCIEMCDDMKNCLIINACLSLYSKKQITLLFDKNINDYDYAIVIRPDMFLNAKIDVNYFNELTDNNIIVPEHQWDFGCNDKLCIGKPKIISYYGKLFDELKLYGETKYIMHKRFLMDKLTEKSITIIPKQIDYDILRISNNEI